MTWVHPAAPWIIAGMLVSMLFAALAFAQAFFSFSLAWIGGGAAAVLAFLVLMRISNRLAEDSA